MNHLMGRWLAVRFFFPGNYTPAKHHHRFFVLFTASTKKNILKKIICLGCKSPGRHTLYRLSRTTAPSSSPLSDATKKKKNEAIIAIIENHQCLDRRGCLGPNVMLYSAGDMRAGVSTCVVDRSLHLPSRMRSVSAAC